MLVCATLFWAGNFTIAKFAYLENIPPYTLAFLRWSFVWIILFPFTYKEIFKVKNEIKKNLSLFFILGLVDDLKINIRPKFRLLIMIGLLIILVIKNDFYIEKSGLNFLNNLLETDIFALIFICICFLFIINGSNLIDGFNGLLAIHTLIIFIVLFFFIPTL